MEEDGEDQFDLKLEDPPEGMAHTPVFLPGESTWDRGACGIITNSLFTDT